MKILITGGTGLIGSSLIDKLTSHQVAVLCRNQINAKNQLPRGIELTTSLSDIDFNELDVVINLAGEPLANKRWTEKQKANICQSRWQLTQQLTDHIKQSATPPHTFISGSAIGFYGRQGCQAIDEDFLNTHDEFSHHLCQQWEAIACNAQSDNTRVCLIRTGIVLAKERGALAKMLPSFKLGLGGPIADGNQMMSWIHIDDMVAVLQETMVNESLSGVINATAPGAVSNEEFAKTLSTVLNRPCVFRMPKFMMKLLFGELSDLLIYGQNVAPTKLMALDFKFKFPQLKQALGEILN